MTAQDRRDPECLFCHIVAGDRPAEVVFESPATVAFLDRFPAARGHTLVVPRQHASTLLQLDDGAAGALFGALLWAFLRFLFLPAGVNLPFNAMIPSSILAASCLFFGCSMVLLLPIERRMLAWLLPHEEKKEEPRERKYRQSA